MRVLAMILATSCLASCAETHGEGRGDHEMAALVEGTLVVGGAVGASYECASQWDDCKTELLWTTVAVAGIATVIGGLVYAEQRYRRHEDEEIHVHVRAMPRDGDIAFAFTYPRGTPEVGEKTFPGAVPLDPTTHTADLVAMRRVRVCVAYAPAIDAPIDEAHCFDAGPNLWFAPTSWRESRVTAP